MLTVDALRLYLREPTADAGQVQQIVDLTNDLVDEHGPYLDEPVKVRLIRFNVAARAWRNPRGLTSYTEGIDDHTETWRFDRSTPGTGVYLTELEEADLDAIASGAARVRETPWAGSLPYRR